MYEDKNSALNPNVRDGGSNSAVNSAVNSADNAEDDDAEVIVAATAAIGNSGAGNAEDDYAEVMEAATAATDLARVDENNTYDMQPPRRRTGISGCGGTAGSSSKCIRPSPTGGFCKNNAIKGSSHCKGHTCPTLGCTSGKSTKMATCPEHVHGSSGGAVNRRGGGGRAARPRPESGEVFYDSFAPASGATAAGSSGDGGGAIYAVSTKPTARRKKQQQPQQAALDANATYATPIRPVPEEDYVALDEMPSNDEASLMYDLPAATTGNSAAVPEPAKIGAGTVVLGAASIRMEDEGDYDEMDC